MKIKIGSKVLLIFIFLVTILFTIKTSLASSGWYYGDLHQHSEYSSVLGGCLKETLNPFGYTIEELKEHAEQDGVGNPYYWLSITDHSYCLDSSEWNTIVQDASDNSYPNSNYLFLPSEELSVEDTSASSLDEILCVNCITSLPGATCGFIAESNTKSAHLGAHGINNFISQSPSNVWCPNSPTAQDAINTVNNDGGVSIINHPKEPLWWDFISLDDINNEKGIEIWNGDWGDKNENAKNAWVDRLLSGKTTYVYSGTDSHDEITTIVYNFAYLEDFTKAGLKDALKSGTVSVSNNGYVTLYVKTGRDNTWRYMGESTEVCSGDEVTIKLYYYVYNSDCNLKLYKGTIGGSESLEQDFGTVSGSSGSPKQHTDYVNSNSYYRAECISSNGEYRAYTNPIWVNIDITDSDSDGYAETCDCNDNDNSIHPPDIDENANNLCDGADNDCDNVIDENCGECTEDDTRPCGTDVGECQSGTRTCTNGAWGDCVGEIGPTAEACPYDGKDNDCDGYIDENVCGGEECYDWDADPSGEYSNYIEDVDYGPHCANGYNWRRVDVDEDGYEEWYMLIPPGGSVTYVAWAKCEAQSGYAIDDFINYANTQSYGCFDGTCNEQNEKADYTSYQNVYTTPSSTISYPDMYCLVNGYGWGWHGGDLWRYWDANNNGQWDSGEHIEYNMVLNCGVDEECKVNEYCYKQTLSDPTSYYCRSKCGNGICEPGEVCPGDSQGNEICDDIDNDCDGLTDEGCDDDNDDYCDDGMEISGSPNTCTLGDNDCDDGNMSINPGATEVCDDGLDNDCDVYIDSQDSDCLPPNNPPTTPTSLLCDNEPCTNNGTFSGSIELNCSGSTDNESDSITYFIDSYYNLTETGSSGGGEGNLMGYWKMNEADDGSTYNATDSSVYGQVGNNIGFVFINGKLGNAANGTFAGAKFEMGNNAIYDLKGDFTLAAWVKIPNSGAYMGVLTRGTPGFPNNGEWQLAIHSSKYPRFYGVEDLGVASPNVGGDVLTPEVWHRIVITRDSTITTNSLKMYINGTLVAQGNLATSANFSGNGQILTIGYTDLGYGSHIGFLIDDVQIWNVTWDENDVTEDWNNGSGREADETSGGYGGYAWQSIGNHSETSILDWDIKNIQPQSEVDLRCRAIDLEGSNTYSDYYSPLINLTIVLPNDTSKFYIKNSSQDNVAWLGNSGNIVLEGICNVLSDCLVSSENLFVIGNSTDDATAYVNSTGDLCIEKGACSSNASCTEKNAFKIRNSTQELVSYIDFNGELCFTGGLYENVEL